MMRPMLFDVDVSVRPARMTILFPRPFGQHVAITVRIRRDVGAEALTVDAARVAAFAELAGFTPEQLELLEESATLAGSAFPTSYTP